MLHVVANPSCCIGICKSIPFHGQMVVQITFALLTAIKTVSIMYKLFKLFMAMTSLFYSISLPNFAIELISMHLFHLCVRRLCLALLVFMIKFFNSLNIAFAISNTFRSLVRTEPFEDHRQSQLIFRGTSAAAYT